MANDILVKVGADISDFSRKMAESNKALSNFGKANAETFDAFKKTGAAVTGAGLALAGGLGIAVNEAIKFESSFAGVRKTVDASEPEFAALQRGFRGLAKEIPLSVNEINAIGESAGQLGIEKKHILGFTRTMADLGVATNMTSEQAATSLARLANITQMPQSEFDRLGSTVVALGNNLATTESEIVDMSLRLAGAGKQVGMTEAEILSFSGALSSVGSEAEAGGSAFSKVMVQMQLAAEKGGKELDNFAKVAGMSADEFKVAFEQDASGAIIKFIEGLATAEERGLSAIGILDEMGITEVRMRDALLRAAGASDVFTESLEIGTKAWDENTALTDEAAERYKTLKSQIQLMKNGFIDAAISLGDGLTPAIEKITQFIIELTEKFNNLSESTKQKIAMFAALASIALIVGGGLMLLIGFIPQIIAGFQAVTTVFGALKSALLGVSFPMLALVATIGIVIAAIVHLWRTNEEFRVNIMTIWENIKTLIMGVWEAIKPGAQVFIGILTVLIGVMAQVIGWVVGVVAAFTSWVVSFIQTHSWIMTVIQVLAVIAGVIAGLIVVVGVIVKVFTVLVSIIKIVGAVFVFLTSPIGIIIAVIAGLIAVVVWLGGKFEWLGNLLDGVANFMSNAWNKFLGFFGKGTKDAADEAEEAIEGVSESGKENLDDLAESGTESAGKLKDGVLDNVGEMKEGASFDLEARKTDGLGDLSELNVEGVGEITEMKDGVTTEIGDMKDFSIDDLKGLEIEGIDAMAGLDDGVTSEVSSMTSDVKKDVGDMENVASGDFSGLTKDMSANAKKVRDEVTKSFAGMSKKISEEMGKIRKIASVGMSVIAKDFAQGMTLSSKTISSSMQSISRTFAQGFTLLNKTAQSGLQSINRELDKSTNRMSSTSEKSISLIIKTYKSGFNSVSREVRSGMNKAVSEVNRSNSRIISSVRTLSAQFRSAGIHAMAGLRNGLNAGSGSAYATARRIANNVASTMRTALRERSPSRVAMESGKGRSVGLADGIEEYAYRVDKAADMLAESAIPDVKNIDMSYATPDGITANSLAGAISGTVGVKTRDDLLARSINSLERKLTNLEVVMDSRQVGRIVEPYVTERQEQTSRSYNKWRLR